MTFGESTTGKSSAFECGPWRWYRGVGEVHMNKGGVGEDRGGKETDRCPLTTSTFLYCLLLFHMRCASENTKKSYRCHYVIIFTSPIFVVLK
jgi:hypothetical protein